jgi:aminopeptidase N
MGWPCRFAWRTSPKHPRGPNASSCSRKARTSFTFVGVEQAPVLSLLRGFSAPVALVDDLGDEELIVLLRHDADPFNRWEAGQRLAMTRLVAAVRGDDAGAAVNPLYIDALRDLLRDPGLDPQFKELALLLPSEVYIAEQLTSVDPQRIHAAREGLRRTLARELRADWERAYEAHQATGGYEPVASPPVAGRSPAWP